MRLLASAALLGLALVAAPATAAPRDLSGTWAGVYVYDAPSMQEVEFTARLSSKGNSLTGTTSEPNTFGEPIAKTLGAKLVGTVDARGQVRFTKTYDGSGGVSHSVDYIGNLDKDGRCVSGAWWIGAVSGPFEMCRSERLTS